MGFEPTIEGLEPSAITNLATHHFAVGAFRWTRRIYNRGAFAHCLLMQMHEQAESFRIVDIAVSVFRQSTFPEPNTTAVLEQAIITINTVVDLMIGLLCVLFVSLAYLILERKSRKKSCELVLESATCLFF